MCILMLVFFLKSYSVFKVLSTILQKRTRLLFFFEKQRVHKYRSQKAIRTVAKNAQLASTKAL